MTATTKRPPVQGVQISSRVSSIRIIAHDTQLTPEQRLAQMEFMRQDAIAKINAYHAHWVVMTRAIKD